MVNIKLLFVILDEGHDKKMNLLLNRYGIKVKTVTSASGTATPSILDYFGLIETKKSVFMAVIPDYFSDKILTRIKNVFKLDRQGSGIAFIIPIASSNKFLTDIFKNNTLERSSKNMRKSSDNKYHLIITIVSDGYLDTVIDVLKTVGNFGGTVIKGRELANMIPKSILGFNIEAEKDIILNIVGENERKKLMEEISKVVGIKTQAKGLCMSLPVEDVIGLKSYE